MFAYLRRTHEGGHAAWLANGTGTVHSDRLSVDELKGFMEAAIEGV